MVTPPMRFGCLAPTDLRLDDPDWTPRPQMRNRPPQKIKLSLLLFGVARRTAASHHVAPNHRYQNEVKADQKCHDLGCLADRHHEHNSCHPR
jgi:hypothetical protein